MYNGNMPRIYEIRRKSNESGLLNGDQNPRKKLCFDMSFAMIIATNSENKLDFTDTALGPEI